MIDDAKSYVDNFAPNESMVSVARSYARSQWKKR